MSAALALTGCKKEAPKVVEKPIEAPPAPPPPPPTPESIMDKYGIDKRITIAQDEVPVDDQNPENAERKLVAVLQFFDAMVRGSDAKLKPMLASADQQVLAELVQSKAWEGATKAITHVTVGCATAKAGFDMKDAVLALIQSGDKFEAQLWTYDVSPDGKATFDAAPCPPGILNMISGSKAAPRIRQWTDLIEAQMVLAVKPDEAIDMPVPINVGQKEGDTDEGGGGGGGGGGSPGPAPAPTKDPEGPGKKPLGPGGIKPPRGPGLTP